MPVLHQGAVNIIAWAILIGSATVFLASLTGVAFFAFLTPDRRVFETAETLHDTYYVFGHSKHAIWPMLLCLLLSLATGFVGYIHTDMFINRTVRQHILKAQ